jgi:glycosyltransferase involved in cell wall biosynthesis
VKSAFGEDVYFKLIGDGSYRRPELDLVGIPWCEATEVADTAEIDIGLMPLPDDAWSRGKCGFKALLYMALAIPAVVSPVGVNTEIVEDGENGYCAADEYAWLTALSRLIREPELREKVGRNGRDTVVDRYSVRSQRDRYLSLFDRLSGRERQA